MTQLAVLNNIDHQHLRINPTWSGELGDDYAMVPTFPAEFRRVQAHYPIVFSRSDKAEAFMPVALLSLSNHENLFIQQGEWQASYIPACAECKPFYIGGGAQGQLTVHVDIDSPKLSEDTGIPLFMPHGGNSEYIERIASLLGAIHEHLPEVDNFMQVLKDYDLLEPFSFESPLINDTTAKLTGFYTINETKLSALTAADLAALQQAGFLSEIYMVVASLSQLNALVYRKNQQLRAQAVTGASRAATP